MAKLVILKSFLDSYYDNMIEKSTTHKYIRRVPKSSGKGYNYFYPEDFKKPLKALLSFFGMKEDKIDKAYKNNNIQEAYGVTKQSFAQHVLEYLTNRKTWNKFFANKANREKYKIPEKPVKETEKVTVSEKEIVGGKTKEKVTVEEKETKEKNFKSTWNRSLMRKIYSMYNSVPEDSSTETKAGINTIKVGDSVSYNGRVGKVTKDFENGMVFINFDEGGMGRFAVKDLQKMNPTADEVTETATENAVEQNVNGTNEAVKEEVTETVKENPYNSVGADIVKDYTEKLNKIRNSDRLTEKQKTEIIANEHIPELIDIAVKVSNKTSDTKEQAAEKAKLIVDAIKNNMPENEQSLFLDDYNFETLVDLRWNPNEHENRSQAMMGNQNARKYGLSEEDELEYNKEYNWYKDTYVDGTRENNPYSNEEDTIEGILKEEADTRFKTYGEKDIAYLALKDLHIDTTGKEYTPPAENTDEPKPLTEKQTNEEIKEYKEARKKADLPGIGINYGDRISAMEDSVSLNPNAVNYAYKDTGYIAGSQKEKIQDFWKRKKESGEGTTIEEIDWTSLEENPRYAEQQITKANILGEIDYNSYKEKGMDPRAAYLISRVFAAVPKEPEGRDVTSRKNYVIAINSLKDRLGACKTLFDVKEVVDDVYGEYSQTFDSQILRVPEVNQAKVERDAIVQNRNKVRNDIMEWGRNELLPKYKALGKKERKAVWRYREEMKKDIAAKFREFDPNYNNPDMYVEIDTSNQWWPINVGTEGIFEQEFKTANDKLRAAKAKAKDVFLKDNVTHDVWKELGKFADLRFSKSFQTHYNNLKVYDDKYHTKADGEKYESVGYKYRDKEYDKYETWDWLDAKKNKKAKPESEIIKGKTKRTFEMIVPKTLERKGGRDISVKSTAELKKAFNLRDVQTGTYVQSDPVSAKWHVDNIAAGLADLADVLGIKDEQISLNGRLALAIGARGHGSALAHYEPVERVINITKFKGGGSLGHEWFHSFDNMIAEAITGGNVSVYMSQPNAQTKTYKLMDAFKPNASHDDIPDNELAQNVRNKFINLVNAMMTGDTPETEVIAYNASDVETAKDFFEKKIKFYSGYYDHDGFYTKLANAKTLDEAISAINDKFATTVNLIRNNSEKVGKLAKYEQKRMKDTVRTYEKYRVMAAAYFDSKAEKSDGGEVTVKTGRIVSRFYEDAKKLDAGKQKPYWSTPLEMAARSFEAYLVDKLKEKGQRNDYLSGSATHDVYSGEWYPYPTERDRVKINKAFDELFEVIRNENAIRKAIDILDKPMFIIKGGRFLIRK